MSTWSFLTFMVQFCRRKCKEWQNTRLLLSDQLA